MLDFTSSLYLGFEHSSSSLPSWDRFTLGKPTALAELEGTEQIERELAALVGCESAVIGVSTLHLFWDLFGILGERGWNIFVDGSLYPIARWGVERAAAAGASVRSFMRHDASALRARMSTARMGKPVVVTDGFYPASGTSAPLADYVECAAAQDGLVVVDDTQALGIFGRSPDASPPYGKGGGGTLQRHASGDSAILVVSSLAKAFGVPVAMLGGSSRLVAKFRERSATRVHCSPPSAPVLVAARRALEINRNFGESLRHRLADRVIRFRQGLAQLNLLAVPGYFPVQPLRLPRDANLASFYKSLLRSGIQPVLNRDSSDASVRISFVFTVRHRLSEIGRALEGLANALRRACFEN